MVTTVTTVKTVVPVIADICTPWWLYDGISESAIIAAYDPIQSLSLSDSYINRANPGTYDCSVSGSAPTWADGTGWTFNGSSQGLATGIAINDTDFTIILRYSGSAAGDNRIAMGVNNGTSEYVYMNPLNASNNAVFGYAASKTYANANIGVIAIANRKCYINGIQVETLDVAGSFTSNSLYFGKGGAGAVYWWSGNIQAAAIYNSELSATEIGTLTVAMNWLTSSSGV